MKVKVRKHFFAVMSENGSEKWGSGTDLVKMIDVPSTVIPIMTKGMELRFIGAWEKNSSLYQESVDRVSLEVRGGRSLVVIHLEDENFTAAKMIETEVCSSNASQKELGDAIQKSFSESVTCAKKDGWKNEK